MKSKKKIIVTLVVIVAVICLYLLLNPKMKTQMALSSTIEDKSVHRAIIIRNEKAVIDFSGNQFEFSDGIVQSHVSDGEYVKKAKNVATFYKNDNSESTKEMQARLTKVTERIEQIQSFAGADEAFADDKVKIEDDLTNYIKEYAKYSVKKDARNISSVKSKIELASSKKSDTTGEKIKAELLELEKEKASYEKSLENLKTELYSPSSGIFMLKTDGFEKILTKNIVNSISAQEFSKIYDEEKEEKASCKIIDNYTWYAAIEVDSKRAKDFKVGEEVFLRFNTINKNFLGKVESISDDKGDMKIICVSSEQYDVDISTLRKTDITLIKKMYSGLVIPSEAIKKVDGKTGVYALKGKTIRFVETKIIYNDGTSAIVKEYNPFVDTSIPAVTLNLYDEVVVSGKNVYDGMLVKWGNLSWI